MPKTRAFISWSGEPSGSVARALHGWLPTVLNQLDPWVSDTDIDAGAQWWPDVSRNLQDSKFGIACVTPQNRQSTWLHFEAGALAQKVGEPRMCPLLFRLAKADLEPPLSHYQAVVSDRDGIRKLMATLNSALDECVPDNVLNVSFDRAWPDLEQALNDIPTEGLAEPVRVDRELLEEILAIARNLDRRLPRSIVEDVLERARLQGQLRAQEEFLTRDILQRVGDSGKD